MDSLFAKINIDDILQAPDTIHHIRQFALTIVHRINLTMMKHGKTICFFKIEK